MMIWQNPHYLAAAIMAKLATCVATLVWSFVVLSHSDALRDSTAGVYTVMLSAMPEDSWAIAGIALSAASIIRLVMHSKPHWLGSVGYMGLMLFWIYLAISLIVNANHAVRPAALAGAITIALLSIFAYLSTPVRRGDDGQSVE